MRKLFEEDDNNIGKSDISLEMIDFQNDDLVIKQLEEHYNKLIEFSDKYSTKIVTGVSFFKHKEAKKVIESIDNIISKRFGIIFKHVNSNGIGYATIPTPPINFNIINGSSEDFHSYLKDILGKNDKESREVTSKDVKDNKDIKDYDRDYESVIFKIYESFNKMEDVLNGKGVVIDNKKAIIKNLPKDYQLFLIVDFYQLINTYKLTARELTAVLMHEIGHGYTHIEYSYRTTKSTSVIIDSIRDGLKKNKSSNDILKIAYKKVSGEKTNSFNDKIIGLKLIDKYMSTTLKLNNEDNHSFTDSEQLADQFSTRFGLGKDIITGLDKIHYPYKDKQFNIIAMSNTINVLLLIFFIVSMPETIIFVILTFFMFFLVGGENSNEITYDNNLQRYKRVRNDLIRIIRSSNLDKKTMKSFIKNIDVVDAIISETKSDETLFSKISDNLFSWNKKSSRFKKLEEMLEDMSENNLHLASNKLRNI